MPPKQRPSCVFKSRARGSACRCPCEHSSIGPGGAAQLQPTASPAQPVGSPQNQKPPVGCAQGSFRKSRPLPVYSFTLKRPLQEHRRWDIFSYPTPVLTERRRRGIQRRPHTLAHGDSRLPSASDNQREPRQPSDRSSPEKASVGFCFFSAVRVRNRPEATCKARTFELPLSCTTPTLGPMRGVLCTKVTEASNGR